MAQVEEKKKTPKKKFHLDLDERRFHILTAFRLYQTEMYLAQKASEHVKMKCGKCNTILERRVGELLEDYESHKSISVLFETVAVFEPEMYEAIKAKDIPEAIADVISYLTGEEVKKNVIGKVDVIKPAPKPAMPDKSVQNAIQAKDLTDPNKITITRSMPQALKGNGKGGKK